MATDIMQGRELPTTGLKVLLLKLNSPKSLHSGKPHHNKLQKLEDALIEQMLTSTDLTDRGDLDELGELGEMGELD